MRLVGHEGSPAAPLGPDPATSLLALLQACGKDQCTVCGGPVAFVQVAVTDPDRAAEYGRPAGESVRFVFGLCVECNQRYGKEAVTDALVKNYQATLNN